MFTEWVVKIANAGRRLTSPSPSIRDIEQRLQAELLSLTILVIIVLTILGSIVPILVWENTPLLENRYFVLSIVALGVFGGLYFLSRTRQYIIAAAAAVGASSALILAMMLPPPASGDVTLSVYMVIPLILAAVFLPFAAVVVLGIGQLIVLVAIEALYLQAEAEDSWLAFMTTTTILMLILKYHNALVKERGEQQLVEQADELTRLYRATSALFAAKDVATLAEEIARAVVSEFDHADCGLLLIEEDKKHLRRFARAGSYEVKPRAGLTLDGQGLVPEAIRTRQTIYAADVTTHPHYVANESRTRSELVVPLIAPNHGGVIGTFDFQSTEVDAFSAEDQRVIQAFAERAAAAIVSAQGAEERQWLINTLEAQIRQRTQQFERIADRVTAILNNTNDGIAMLNPSGKIQQVNPMFERMFGANIESIFNFPFSKLFDSREAPKIEQALANLSPDAAQNRLEAVVKRMDGSSFYADVTFATMSEENEAGIVCSVRDISERVRTEESLRAALARERELTELKSRFVSMVSHEFRTPMTTIQLVTSTLERHYEQMDAEKRANRYKAIYGQIAHMTNLIEDVLIVGKAEAGQLKFEPTVLNLFQFCDEIVNDFRNLHQTYAFSYEALRESCEAEYFYGDPNLLRHILTNLLSNAVKYSVNHTPVTLRLTCQRTNILIEVEDEGIGIPKANHDHLFTPFYRADNVGTLQGTGLGLLITKYAVEAHGGSITFESEVNRGARFIVSLPNHQHGATLVRDAV